MGILQTIEGNASPPNSGDVAFLGGRASWTPDKFTVEVPATGTFSILENAPAQLQLSRSLDAAKGKHRLHLRVRSAANYRLFLFALAKENELEGLPEQDTGGVEVKLSELLDVVHALRHMGSRVAYGHSHAGAQQSFIDAITPERELERMASAGAERVQQRQREAAEQKQRHEDQLEAAALKRLTLTMRDPRSGFRTTAIIVGSVLALWIVAAIIVYAIEPDFGPNRKKSTWDVIMNALFLSGFIVIMLSVFIVPNVPFRKWLKTQSEWDWMEALPFDWDRESHRDLMSRTYSPDTNITIHVIFQNRAVESQDVDVVIGALPKAKAEVGYRGTLQITSRQLTGTRDLQGPILGHSHYRLQRWFHECVDTLLIPLHRAHPIRKVYFGDVYDFD